NQRNHLREKYQMEMKMSHVQFVLIIFINKVRIKHVH
ncbi:hypothetical protein ACTFIZ_005304, partial [Dictyostelium cf. discoideum]